MEAKEILDHTKKLVWAEIQRYLKDPSFPQVFQVPPKYKKEHDFYWDTISDYPRRQGKYLRPALVLISCEGMGGKITEAIKTAAAMQVSEDWLLVHDDIEDDSLLRRGKPTLHKIYGVEQAINAGDALHALMWKILCDNQKSLGPKKTYLLVSEFYAMVIRTAMGQSVEIKWTQENKGSFNDSDWDFIADGKVSYYTVALPLRLGAIIANASEKQLELLAQFGIYLGRAFQLVDDLLDLTSDFQGLKQPLNDLYEGKRTIMLGHLLRSVSLKEKRLILEIMAKKRETKTEDEVQMIVKKMQKYKSLEYGWSLAQEYGRKALNFIDSNLKFIEKEPARQKLIELTKFVINRDH